MYVYVCVCVCVCVHTFPHLHSDGPEQLGLLVAQCPHQHGSGTAGGKGGAVWSGHAQVMEPLEAGGQILHPPLLPLQPARPVPAQTPLTSPPETAERGEGERGSEEREGGDS